VGLQKDSTVLNGDTSNINQNTMFRFNGNGTYDIMYKGQSIFNEAFASGDQFALRTNFTANKITYYKNEAFVVQSDISSINSTVGFKSKVILGSANGEVNGLKIKVPFVPVLPVSPSIHCSLISVINPLVLAANPNPVCAGSTVALSGQLNNFSGNPISLSSSTYTWQPGNLVGQNQSNVTVPSSQVYTLNVRYSGCTLRKTILISTLPSPTVYIYEKWDITAAGEKCNTGVLVAGGAPNAINFQWFKDGVSVASGSGINTYTPTVNGNYNVEVTYSNGCKSVSSINPVTYQAPSISYAGSPFSQGISSPISVQQTGSSPGIYASSPSGLNIDASTGAITPGLSNPGVYTIQYTPNYSITLFCQNSATTTIEILSGCHIDVNNDHIENVCDGDQIQLIASSPGYIEQYTWVPTTGLSCSNCPNPILTVNSAVTQYTVYGKVKTDQSFYCGYNVVTITTIPNCTQNPIIGCCFSNYGAAVFVTIGTYVNVYCNLLNELGQFPDFNIKKGEFVNKGNIRVKLDWIHNAKNDLYLSNEGVSDFFGYNQNITGNSSTHFNRLDLTGNGVKTTWLDEYANSHLNLTSNVLFVQNNMFFMKNPTASATNTTILTVSSATSIIGGNGFVNTGPNGYLSRKLQAGSSSLYLFPMGTRAIGLVPNIYRPIEMSGSTMTDEISANFMNITPTVTAGSDFENSLYPLNDISDKSSAITNLNSLYYHKLKQTTPTFPSYASTLFIKSYFPSGDGSFQSLAEWEKDPSHGSEWWGTTTGASGSTVPSPALSYLGYIYAATNGLQTFNGQPFTLAQSGPYVGTGGFGGDGTVITITSDGASPTTTTSTTYTNGTTSTTITSTTGGVTTSTITTTTPGGSTTTSTVTVTSVTSGSTTITNTTTAGSGTTSTVSNTTTTTGSVTTSTTTTSTGTGTSTTTSTTSTTPGGVTTSTTSTTDGTTTSTTTSTTSTTPGGVTTSTTSTTDGTTTSTTTSTTSTTPGGVTTSTTSTTDGTTTSTTTNTTSTTGGVTSSTTTVTSGGTTTTEVCETTYGGLSSVTACTLTTATGTTTYTSSTSTSSSGGDGSASSGLGNPFGTGSTGTGSTGVTSPNTPGDYVITITPTDDCALPGKIKFTVNADGTISPSNVKYGLVGDPTYLGPLSEDVYTIDNVNSGIILQSTPKSILKNCINAITVGTSDPGSDYILTAGETIKVFIPNTLTGATFGNFNLFNSANSLIVTSPSTLSLSTNTLSVPVGTPAGVYHFEFSVNSELVKGQLIIK